MKLDAALREAALSSPLALVTLASASGSTPRSAGTRMAVRPDGSIVGTVGGGLPEARAITEALDCLSSGGNSSIKVEMNGAEATGVDLICGGVAELWIEVLVGPSPARACYEAAARAIDRGESVLLVSSKSGGCLAALDRVGASLGPSAGPEPRGLDELAIRLARESGQTLINPSDGLLYSRLEGPDRLLILGGGHVGLALAKIASSLSFRTTVADPRPEYSDPARFPEGVECRNESYAEAIERFRSGNSAYVVIVSPGHIGDLECARAVVAKDYRYAGMIGSRRKSRMLIEELVAEGCPREKAEGLRAPIGADIGAETPEEIAVSIAAELVASRRGSDALGRFDEERRKRRTS
jgi:xanthine dehydrogenase accessory factor